MAACYTGYITQSAIVNMPPLLFIVFSSRYGVSVEKLSLLIALNFLTQMLTDALAGKAVPALGYRLSAVIADLSGASGLIMLGVLPLATDAFAGLCAAFALMAVGGGLNEVIVSPIVDSIPSDDKSAGMSLLHSFYSWGAVGVIVFTTVMNALLPDRLWFLIPVLWAVAPLSNIPLFARCPLPPDAQTEGGGYKKLFGSALFWLTLVVMFCGGAAEQAVGQWASLFTETGLGVNKETGDLLGAGLFAAFMGLSRTLYGVAGRKLPLKKTLTVCVALNAAGLLLTATAPVPAVGFIGCAICGLSIGMAWPGTLSLASGRIADGGTPMFAMLALAGDAGCTVGPTVVGILGGRFDLLGSPLRSGLLYAAAFPLAMFIILLCIKRRSAVNETARVRQSGQTKDGGALWEDSRSARNAPVESTAAENADDKIAETGAKRLRKCGKERAPDG